MAEDNGDQLRRAERLFLFALAIVLQLAIANPYIYIYIYPNAYGSAIKVSYPFAGVYKALQKYVSKEEALQMMKPVFQP